MIRNSGFIESLPPAYKDDFIDPNPIAVHKLGILKEKLKGRLVGSTLLKRRLKDHLGTYIYPSMNPCDYLLNAKTI